MDDLLLPIFPLEIVLFPEEPLPLHIFEERYKLMISECLAAKAAGSARQEFGIVCATAQGVQPVGCAARVVNVTRKYEDGRMDIFAVGTRRFEILYTNEEKAYLRGGVAFFDDDPSCDVASDEEAQPAIELFRRAIQRLRKSDEVPVHLTRPYRYLSFRIAGGLPLDLEFKQQLLGIRNESERIKLVSRIVEKLIIKLEVVEKTRAKAGGNGNARSHT
ncbi:MAG: LON peptidase substrate-binding domain-containing protein [Terriglobia bacterium]